MVDVKFKRINVNVFISTLIVILVLFSLVSCTTENSKDTSNSDKLPEKSTSSDKPTIVGYQKPTSSANSEVIEPSNPTTTTSSTTTSSDSTTPIPVSSTTPIATTTSTTTSSSTTSTTTASTTVTPTTSTSIPKDTYALFYTTSLSSLQENLPVQVQYNDIEGGGYATNIQWETSTSAVVKYMPEIDRVDLMKKGSSSSWSQNVMYPFTTSGRFFVLRDWGSDWNADNSQWTLTEINPTTGAVIQETGFNADSFGIIGNKIYLSTGRITDFYGRITSYGNLKVMDLGESSSYYAPELMRYTEDNPAGTLYGTGNSLFSLVWKYVDDQIVYDVRTHDLNTGQATIIFNNLYLDDFAQAHIFPGENAMYIGSKVNGGIWFLQLSADGSSKTIPVELDMLGSYPGAYLTEDNGQLIIAEADGATIKTLSSFDLTTQELKQIPIEPFGADASFNRVGFPALILG